MSHDGFQGEDGARSDRPSRMRLYIGAGLTGMCLLGALGGMLHLLPA